MAPADTKLRILDAAERLFSERGYDATSLRGVTGEAGVNLAAVHYHFQSKVGLFKAVFERRVHGVNRDRLRRLDELEGRGDAQPPTLEEILSAFLVPAMGLLTQRDDGADRFLKLVGRLYSATGEHVQALKDVFREIEARFVPALGRALPALSPAELCWRFHFLIGSMCTLMADPTRIRLASEGMCDSEDPDEVVRQLVAYSAAGLRAPSPAPAAAVSERAEPVER